MSHSYLKQLYLLLGNTIKGICAVKLGDRAVDLVQTLNQEFGSAANIREDRQHPEWINQILNTIKGREKDLNIPLDIRSTPFQKQVWQTLQKIPYGETRTYKEVAQELGKPQATRAVGNACGANPVALLIPCHRVLRSDGSLGGYRWGIKRKQKLLAIEQYNNQEHR
ncbi:MAG: methylated-DNA--[protein]-cysteine S-methyltransferase [Cyanobacteria bacterium P01_A01_bin.40]